MAWYRNGTVSLSNGSPVVTGQNTLWTTQCKAGDVFTLDNIRLYEIKSVDSDTQITLTEAYGGATAGGLGYAIIPNFTNTTNADLAAKIAKLVNDRQTNITEMISWLSGTAAGGPNADGTYPITDFYGNVFYVKSAARFQQDVDNATTQANTATSIANSASAGANDALTRAQTAIDDANAAKATADNATAESQTATANANSATASANTATSNANTATAAANTATANADTATTSALAAAALANAAAANAQNQNFTTLAASTSVTSAEFDFAANAQYLWGHKADGTRTRLFGLDASNDLYIGGIDAAINSLQFGAAPAVFGSTVQLANAVASNHAVALGQADGRYAALAGLSTQNFAVNILTAAGDINGSGNLKISRVDPAFTLDTTNYYPKILFSKLGATFASFTGYAGSGMLYSVNTGLVHHFQVNGADSVLIRNVWAAPAAGVGLLYGNATLGFAIAGSGSQYDVTLLNKTGATALGIVTGTQRVQVGGSFTDTGDLFQANGSIYGKGINSLGMIHAWMPGSTTIVEAARLETQGNQGTGRGTGLNFYVPYNGGSGLGGQIASVWNAGIDLAFLTAPNTSTLPIEAMRILGNNQHVLIGKTTDDGSGALAQVNGTVSLAAAVSAGHAVNLGQADGRYAALNGSSVQNFAIATGTFYGAIRSQFAMPFGVNGLMEGDIAAVRGGGTGGAVFLDASGAKYLYNDGTFYQLGAQDLKINGSLAWHSGNLSNLSQLANGPGYLTSSGTINYAYYLMGLSNVAAESGGTAGPVGLSLRGVYSGGGYPAPYGNLLHMDANGGQGQLLIGWNGSSTPGNGYNADNFIRSLRDGHQAWSPWAKLWTDQNLTNLSQLTNGPGFITAGGAPVQSVAGRTGAVSLSTSDISGMNGYLVKPGGAGGLNGVTALLRSDAAPDTYNVQSWWDGNYWQLKGYNNTTYHAGVRVATADLLGGLGLSPNGSAIGANQVLRSDANGYTYHSWINTLSGDMGGSAIGSGGRVYCSNDTFLRYKTLANFAAEITGYLGKVGSAGGADNATKWNGASKTVSTALPSGGVDGDVWFQYS